MKHTNHRDGRVSLDLSPSEAVHLWRLVREGRRAHDKQYANYDSAFALDLMRALPGLNGDDLNEHIGRFGRG